jgi:hypothetical protein
LPEGLARRLGVEQLLVVAGAGADEDATAPPLDCRAGMSCMLQRLPGYLEEQPLLGGRVAGLDAQQPFMRPKLG